MTFADNKLIVREVNLNHQNHSCDQQTFDHHPENVRLSDDDLNIAKQMIEVDGNKQRIKIYLTKKSGKPVLLKALHNIQTNNHTEKNVGPHNELQKLYNILANIPNANVCFISDDDDVLVGKIVYSPFIYSLPPILFVLLLQAFFFKTNECTTCMQNIRSWCFTMPHTN